MKIKTLLGMALVFFTLIAASGSSYAEAKTRKVLDGKAKIALPKEYSRMSERTLNKTYPPSERPKEVWYVNSRNDKALIVFNLFEMKGKRISESHLRTIAGSMKEEFEPYSPSMKEGKVNGRKVVWIEVKNAAVGSARKRNMLVQLSVYQGKLMTVSLIVEKESSDRLFKAGEAALKTLSY